MATTAAVQQRKPAPVALDRRFYTTMSIAMAATVFIGFARTYYLSGVFGTHGTISGGPISPLIHLHAFVFTSWVLLFVVQTSLVATHRVKVHRQLGILGGVLAAAMLIVGPMTAIASARRGGAPAGVDPINFLAVPFGDVTMFALFAAGGFLWRKDKERHKRLMLVAFACLTTAAWARWPGVLPLGPLVYYALTLLWVVAGALYDRFSRGQIHPVYKWGGPLLVLGVVVRVLLLGSPTWHRIAQAIVGS